MLPAGIIQPMGAGFGSRLAKALAHRGMTQADLGRALGWNSARISRYTTGDRRRVDADTFRPIARVLGVSYDWLAFAEGEPSYVEPWARPAPAAFAFESTEVDLAEHRQRVVAAGGAAEPDIYPDREVAIIALGEDIDPRVLQILLRMKGPDYESLDFDGWVAKAAEVRAKIEGAVRVYRGESPPAQSPAAKRTKSLGHTSGGHV